MVYASLLNILDERDLRDLLSEWHIESVEETEESSTGEILPGSWHWVIVARNPGGRRVSTGSG